MALILAFDTSAGHCAAAVLDGDEVLAAQAEEMTRGQAERLFPLLQAVLDKAGRPLSDMTCIGVGTGPGNFTGTRIAVAAARGRGHAGTSPRRRRRRRRRSRRRRTEAGAAEDGVQ